MVSLGEQVGKELEAVLRARAAAREARLEGHKRRMEQEEKAYQARLAELKLKAGMRQKR